MKNIKYILLLLTVLAFSACEKVIDVDLDTAPPRLVVDASINWVKGTAGNDQTIKLTTTAGYYESTVPPANGATVFITDEDGMQYDFAENAGTGDYTCHNFVPVLNKTYTLTILYNGETYTATEKLYGVPAIGDITQNDDGGFLGDNIEVRFYYQDDPEADNFYMIRFDTDILPYPDYTVLDDEFTQGNEMFGIFSADDLDHGDTLGINLYGISERYYNYMNQIIAISNGGAGSGPFQTVPDNVTGNVVNQTNESHFAAGYFRLSETAVTTYTVQ